MVMDKTFNWDDVQETSYINEEGKHTLKVMSFENKTTANGNDCHAYLCQNKDGEQITLNLYLVEKAMWKYKNFVKACLGAASGVTNLDELPKALVGKKFVGEVKRQPDRLNIETGLMEPSKYFEVAKFYPIEG